MIAILDYRAGNLTSVARALDFLGFPCEVTASHQHIRAAERIIFPGVGAAGKAMHDLRELGLDLLLRERFEAGVPILGFVWGYRCCFDSSEENDTTCLGIFPGRVRLFPRDLRNERHEPLKVPHMGWTKWTSRSLTRYSPGYRPAVNSTSSTATIPIPRTGPCPGPH